MKKINIFIVAFICIILGGAAAFFVYEKKTYPLAFKQEIIAESEEKNISPALVASIINAESSFDEKCVSQAGAIGLMQLMPKTAKWMASKIGIKNYTDNMLFDGKINIKIGVAYLSYLIKKFNNIDTALAAYNAGEGQVKVWLLSTNYSNDKISLHSTPFSETNNYIAKVKYSLPKYEKKFS